MCKIAGYANLKERRLGVHDDGGELLDESTQSGAIDGACLFTRRMLPALEEAVENPDMTEELAEIPSAPTVDVEYRVESDVNV